MKNRKRSTIVATLSKTIFLRFFITLVLFVLAVILLMFTAKLILMQYTWQPGLVYRILSQIDEHQIEVVAACALLGFLGIFVFYWRKTLGYIDTVVDASEVLVAPGEDPVRLPAELKQVEDRMNLAKLDAARNARLAKEAEQRKNDLIVYLAHDIKTPLTSVIGYLSLLDEAPDMPLEQKAKYIHITLDKAYRLEQLIGEFFEVTRYNLHTIPLVKQQVDLQYLLVQLIDEFYPQLENGGKEARLYAAEGLQVAADPDKLARVFNNILKNAIAYSNPGGVIDIFAQQSGEWMSIVFQNAGFIPEHKITAIFEKFYRLDDARSSATGGAGLGLAIAKEIVAQHGGQIAAESKDGLTTFTVWLPAAQTPPPQENLPEAASIS